MSALEEQVVVKDQIRRELPEAQKDFEADKAAGLIDVLNDGTDFRRWLAQGNGEIYQGAVARAKQLAAIIQSLQASISGIKASAFGDKRDGLALAGASIPNPG